MKESDRWLWKLWQSMRLPRNSSDEKSKGRGWSPHIFWMLRKRKPGRIPVFLYSTFKKVLIYFPSFSNKMFIFY